MFFRTKIKEKHYVIETISCLNKNKACGDLSKSYNEAEEKLIRNWVETTNV